jgi:hypothetical protein
MSLMMDTIESRIRAGIKRPVLIEGPPGGGKTQGVKQIADRLGIGFKMIHAPLKQPEDLGLPVVSAKRDSVKFIVPADDFPMVGSECEEEGIICIDELAQADNSIQKILANLMQEREIHGQKLKPGWTIIATGNRQKDRAGANRILSHLRNRMTTIELEPHLDDWCAWYMEQPNCSFEGLSFLRFRPGLLMEFDPQRDVNPTPRAWVEGVFATMGTIPAEAEMESFKGDVGEGAAAEFVGFLQIYRSLPDPDVILMNPDKAAVPSESATLYALSGALAQRATNTNFDRVMAYANRMPPEFSVIVVRTATQKDKTIAETKAFKTWAIGPGAKLIG